MTRKITLFLLLTVSGSLAWAKGAGTSAVSVLEDPTSARASALGEAFSAVRDDVSAMGYNPASLGSLRSNQVNFLYKAGMAEDATGHIDLGMNGERTSWGISMGYYNAGDFNTVDQNGLPRSLNAKTDLALTLGFARKKEWGSWGLAGKVIQSELAETEKGTAYAADVGIQIPFINTLTLGFALQNFGSQMKYRNEGDDLPRTVRGGFSLRVVRKFPTFVFFDVPYNLVTEEVAPAGGIEIQLKPIALRAGYKNGSDLRSVTLGAGFLVGNLSLNYSYGFVDELDSEQQVSIALSFGPKEKPDYVQTGPDQNSVYYESTWRRERETEEAESRSGNDEIVATNDDLGNKVDLP